MPTTWAQGGYGYGVVLAMPDLDWRELESQANAVLTKQSERAGLDEPEQIIEEGDPATAICDAADAHDVDVIVVGSHDRNLLSRLIQPSVATGVVRGTHIPVLVISGSPSDDSE